ncbi:MAG: transcription factor FapR [Heliobacteriaceae bacterium]|nr:transcription factor FapR [Heliobacteriaceae bacterium]MDD4587006.1 transcription factor FapR [Heliobacteriaceae bacterium]
MARRKKQARQAELEKLLEENLFQTDSELAHRLGVSIQTIRLDRQEIGIPELRQRTKQVAAERLREVRSLSGGEIVGELTGLVLGKEGSSRLRITEGMLLRHQGILRGHHLFAQANSLAVAIIDAPVVLTGLARVRFRRPVIAGEVVTAMAKVVRVVGVRHIIRVVSNVDEERVFSGKFYVVARNKASRR